MAEQNPAPVTKWDTGTPVLCIAVSHDGTRLISGSVDGRVRIWDMCTGALVLKPFGVHSDVVWSVACSQDDSLIVSGWESGAVCLWDARTGLLVGEPLGGHTDTVKSVGFSPDGIWMVSGSNDGTIRIWDLRSETLVGEPLRNDPGVVLSVAFSPDSTRIVSGSWDSAIRIWDLDSRSLINEPLIGHLSAVYSVSFSLDGKYIVSGSDDDSICIWNATTGIPLSEPLRGHTGTVWSVRFSPDSIYIVSGSADGTILIWDTRTQAPIGEPFRGHTSIIASVAFSSNGMRIISGSYDCTICVWEAPQRTPSFDMVSSQMSTQEMFDCLVKHGCADLSLLLDPDRSSSSVIATGGFGDVWRGSLSDSTLVAIKTLRLPLLLAGDDKGIKRAVREVYLWSRARHGNIQELLGIVMFHDGLGMVSPWRERGNLQLYIVTNPDVERFPLCVQLITGVAYLHSIDMVHGDLKASNVLVSEDGTLKINDFDHAILSHTTLRFTTTSRPGGGTLRWMAPELFQTEDENEGETESQVTRSKRTDIYAAAMTMIEIITGAVPYAEYRTDAGVYGAIYRKQLPRRPQELSGLGERGSQMWEFLVQCWDHDSSARPDAYSALESLLRFALG